MANVNEQLERSAIIVNSWGKSQLPNGKTLTEQMTFDGLSLWEVLAPVVALYYVPVALSSDMQQPSFAKRLRPFISLTKRRVLNHIKRHQARRVCEEWPTCPAFLFLGFSGYMYRDVLHPVAEYLAGNKGCQNVAIHDEQHARNAPIPMDAIKSQSIWQHWDGEVEKEVRLLRRRLGKAIFELQAMEIFPQLFNYEGQALWPQMQNALNWLFRFHLPLLVPQAAIARHILQRHQPLLIISADVADPRTRVYCLLGRHMNIPSIEIQFGPSGAEGVEWQFLAADRIATWGEITCDALQQHGVPAEQITITGSPRHDSLLNVSADAVVQTRERFGIPAGYTMVLCASTYQQKEYNSLSDPELLISMKRAVFHAAGQIDGLYLIVKPHPLEDVQDTKQLIGEGRNILFADAADDIRELTKACDVFVGFGSTATVDALIANKLTICPAFPGWVWSDMFVKSDATLVPRSEEELLNSFQGVVDGSLDTVMAELNPARLRFLQKWAYKIDGQSSERIAEMAIEMTRKGYQ